MPSTAAIASTFSLDHLIEEEGITYLARTESIDPDNTLAPLQAAASTWRIAIICEQGQALTVAYSL